MIFDAFTVKCGGKKTSAKYLCYRILLLAVAILACSGNLIGQYFKLMFTLITRCRHRRVAGVRCLYVAVR